jgi:hypothetical protein
MTTLAVGNRRLLKLAAILDAADKRHRERQEPTYNQAAFVHPCGTPACAIGHWAAANPRRWRISSIGPIGLVEPRNSRPLGVFQEAVKEFALDAHDYGWDELFSKDGCGSAKNGKQAAKYIRQYVARRTPGTAAYKRAQKDIAEADYSSESAE